MNKTTDNLCDYLDATEEEIDRVINVLNDDEMALFNKRYNGNYKVPCHVVLKNGEVYSFRNLIISKLKTAIKRTREPKRKTTDYLCDYLHDSNENIDRALKYLTEEELVIFNKKYNGNFKKPIYIVLNKNEEKVFSNVIIPKLLEYLEKFKYDDISAFLNSPIEKIDLALEILSGDEMALFNKRYNGNYKVPTYVELDKKESLIFKKNIIPKLKTAIKRIDNKSTKTDDLCAYLNATEEEIDNVLHVLSEEELEIFNKRYNGNYKEPVFTFLGGIQSDIFRNHVIPKLKYGIKRFRVKNEYNNLCAHLNVTEEELDEAIKFLTEDELKVFNKRYNGNYKKPVYVELSDEEDKIFTYSVLPRLRRVLNKNSKCKTDDLCAYLGATKEEIDSVLDCLSEEELEVFNKRYNGDYTKPSHVVLNENDSLIFSSYVIFKLKKALGKNNAIYVADDLCAYLDATYEEVDKLLLELTEEELSAFNKRYAGDYKTPVHIKLDEKDQKIFSNILSKLKRKIKKLKANKVSADNLREYLGVSDIDFEKVINLLSDYDINLLNKRYNGNYYATCKSTLSEKEEAKFRLLLDRMVSLSARFSKIKKLEVINENTLLKIMRENSINGVCTLNVSELANEMRTSSVIVENYIRLLESRSDIKTAYDPITQSTKIYTEKIDKKTEKRNLIYEKIKEKETINLDILASDLNMYKASLKYYLSELKDMGLIDYDDEVASINKITKTDVYDQPKVMVKKPVVITLHSVVEKNKASIRNLSEEEKDKIANDYMLKTTKSNKVSTTKKKQEEKTEKPKQEPKTARDDLCKYLNATCEEIDSILYVLTEEEMEIFNKRYNGNYKIPVHIVLHGEDSYMFKSIIIYKLKRAIASLKSEDLKTDDLCKYLGATKEEIDSVLYILSEEELKIFNKRYNNDYTKPIKVKLEPSERLTFKGYVIPKLKTAIKSLRNPSTKHITDNLCKYLGATKEEIDSILYVLSKEDLKVFNKRYNGDYTKPARIVLNEDERTIFNASVLRKLKIAIKKIKEPDSKRKSRDNICQYLNITVDELTKLLPTLTDADLKVLNKRYNGDFSKPSKVRLSKEEGIILNNVITKLKMRIAKPNYKTEDITSKEIDCESVKTVETYEDIKAVETNKNVEDIDIKQQENNIVENKYDDFISKSDYMKIREIFKSREFINLTKQLPEKECFIITLKLHKDVILSDLQIAQIMQIDVTEVKDIVKKVLTEYKNKLNEYMFNALKQLDERQKTILPRKD